MSKHGLSRLVREPSDCSRMGGTVVGVVDVFTSVEGRTRILEEI